MGNLELKVRHSLLPEQGVCVGGTDVVAQGGVCTQT